MRSRGSSSQKKLSSFLVILFVLFSSIFFTFRSAEAQGSVMFGYKVGSWVGEHWEGVQHVTHMITDRNYRENSIVKTALQVGITAVTAIPAEVATGRNPDTLSNCGLIARDLDENGVLADISVPNTIAWLGTVYSGDELAAAEWIASEAAARISELAGETDNEQVCNLNATPLSVASSGGYGSGSLLSMAIRMDRAIQRDEVPVNMAYFFKDYAQRIPVVKNTAFAQTSDQYTGAQMVYTVWKLVRDVSLGLMSLFLLVVGMMIMTRKKINPQTVVTVQNALPRVAISIILIFFSYVLGSFFIQLMSPLKAVMRASVGSIITGTVSNSIPTSWAPVLTGEGIRTLIGVGILLVVGSLSWETAGLAALAGLIAVLLALIVVVLIALIKTMIIYIKLLTYTIISPLYFAMGVIPGKESMVIDWFKEMTAGVLSVTAMTFMIWFSFAIPFLMFDASSGSGEFLSSTLTALFTPTMMIFVLITAIKMPKKVSAWIKGDPKKR